MKRDDMTLEELLWSEQPLTAEELLIAFFAGYLGYRLSEDSVLVVADPGRHPNVVVQLEGETVVWQGRPDDERTFELIKGAEGAFLRLENLLPASSTKGAQA